MTRCLPSAKTSRRNMRCVARRDRGGSAMVARRRGGWRRGDARSSAEKKPRSAAANDDFDREGDAIGSSLDGIGDAIGSSLDGIGSSLDDDGRAAGRARGPSELDMDAEFDAVARERAWVSFASGDDEDAPGTATAFFAEDASVDGTVDSMDDDLRRYTGEGRG